MFNNVLVFVGVMECLVSVIYRVFQKELYKFESV